ncbi:hypothetical protein CCACVL1_04897 [Corchorus capsularis]|uniref:F-box domain-containing protein n=1 Tax=Corchorus capsularis TaxID=210143 RepID=A0A1R3JNV5_COCAP|nr:hypothetical protein CCACVL1_04897 [Corchorus capsularis]
MATTTQKSKKAKKNHAIEEEVIEKDRLSDLPDCILLHILSFLPDIRFCVRTTLLSSRWNNLWASVPDLIFDRGESRNASSFKKFVRNVLNKRENLPVNKFTFKYDEKDKSVINTIIKYAMSHNVQHFSIITKSASLTYLSPFFNISVSLKTLELRYFDNMYLLENFTLPSLTSLSLRWCTFGDGEPISIDPFVGLFNLKSLQLAACSASARRFEMRGLLGIGSVRNFKISGPQLDSLIVIGLGDCKVEIFAPKLHCFSATGVHLMKFSHLPLLEVAEIIEINLAFLLDSEEEAYVKSLLDLIKLKDSNAHQQEATKLGAVAAYITANTLLAGGSSDFSFVFAPHWLIMAGRIQKTKKAKKNHGEEGVVEKDRLSDLSDCILLHILSFLPDIRFCVRTTVLSKRWNNLWASLPDLFFDKLESRNTTFSWFKQFVRHVMWRRKNLPLNKFSFGYHRTLEDDSMFATIIKYAMSYNVQHFSLYLQSASLTYLSPFFNISVSLKTLELQGFDNMHLLEDFTLPNLTTLSLYWCRFGGKVNGEPISIDPFVRLVNLKTLELIGSSIRRSVGNFKISGPQLDSLTLPLSGSSDHCKVEIIAPKLRFFSCTSHDPVKFSHLDLPLLEIAEIFVGLPFLNKDESLLELINLFRGLYNAQSLLLYSNIVKGFMDCPQVLENQPSPFFRLKTLKVKRRYSFHGAFKIPDIVIKYFGENITVESN